ncbi:MAG TPA: c-type cytochrome [Aliidongia sp.]|nr:c-type cytochrome [Aliidongia sp.]
MLVGLTPCGAFAAGEGEELAQHHCAKCHEIAPGVKPETPNAAAPSFAAIAGDPKKYPEARIFAVLSGPHAKMEPYAFTAIERQSLIAYIQSQAKK